MTRGRQLIPDLDDTALSEEDIVCFLSCVSYGRVTSWEQLTETEELKGFAQLQGHNKNDFIWGTIKAMSARHSTRANETVRKEFEYALLPVWHLASDLHQTC